jgi:prevent-host-death family protein
MIAWNVCVPVEERGRAMSNASNQNMDLAEFKNRIDRVVARVRDEKTRVTLDLDGKPAAVLVPYRDLARLQRLDEQDREAREIIEAMRAPFRDVPPDELEREVARAVAEVKAEMRAERQRAVTSG